MKYFNLNYNVDTGDVVLAQRPDGKNIVVSNMDFQFLSKQIDDWDDFFLTALESHLKICILGKTSESTKKLSKEDLFKLIHEMRNKYQTMLNNSGAVSFIISDKIKKLKSKFGDDENFAEIERMLGKLL